MYTTYINHNITHRPPAYQLEDLDEREENEADDEDWFDSADLTPQFWEHDDEETSSPATSTTSSLPIHIIERKSDSNNNPSKSTTVKRTIKSMLSSILNWKNSSKGLPKGSREYYAARESLGEEMRAFRRDTMPRLMEHATVKGKFDRNNRIEVQEMRDDQREFSELIGSPKESSPIIVANEEPSIATIHPVYGSSNNHQRRSWHKQDFPDIDENKQENKEVVYGSIKVQVYNVYLIIKPFLQCACSLLIY